MIKFDVKADVREAQSFLRNLKGRAIPRAAARAINDVLITLRAEGAREIKADHPAMKIGDIKKNVAMYRATPTKLDGSLETIGRPLSLLLFGATQGKRGVSARIGKARKQLVLYHGRRGFTVAKYGGEVFVRRAAKGRALRRFRGPSMPGVFRAQSPFFLRRAAERWAQTFPSRLQYEIELAKK